MKCLFYFGHPAQYHFCKHSIHALRSDGHEIKILIKTKDVLEDLVKNDFEEYSNIQPKARKNNSFSMLLAMFKRDIRVMRIMRIFKPDVLIGSDPSLAHAGFIFRKPSITPVEDDYAVIKHYARLTYPFTNCILCPEICTTGPWTKKRRGYNAYMKLAYLHPKYFTPDIKLLKDELSSKNCLIRLSSLHAHHDIGASGIGKPLLREIVNTLDDRGFKVFLLSEDPNEKLEGACSIKTEAWNIHHLLAHMDILICDSQSMTVEAAILGVAAIRINSFKNKISVLNELERKYKLCYAFFPEDHEMIMRKLNELLAMKNLKQCFHSRREAMLSEKEDVNTVLINTIHFFYHDMGK